MNNLEKLCGKKNKNIGEILLRNTSILAENFSEWINATKQVGSIAENMRNAINELNELNEMIYMNRNNEETRNNNSYINIYEIDIKNIVNVSKWEDGVKPIKLILSVSVSDKKNFEVIDGVINRYEDPSSLYSLRFAINDMALLMEDGSFRTDI